jgi:hypothetical protein
VAPITGLAPVPGVLPDRPRLTPCLVPGDADAAATEPGPVAAAAGEMVSCVLRATAAITATTATAALPVAAARTLRPVTRIARGRFSAAGKPEVPKGSARCPVSGVRYTPWAASPASSSTSRRRSAGSPTTGSRLSIISGA